MTDPMIIDYGKALEEACAYLARDAHSVHADPELGEICPDLACAGAQAVYPMAALDPQRR